MATEAEGDVSASLMTSSDDFRSADEPLHRSPMVLRRGSQPPPPGWIVDGQELVAKDRSAEDRVGSGADRQRAVEWRGRPHSAVPPFSSNSCTLSPNCPTWTKGPHGGTHVVSADYGCAGSISGGRMTMPTQTVDEDRDTDVKFRFVCRDNLGGGVCSSPTFQPFDLLSDGQLVAAADTDVSGVVPTPPPPSSPGVVPLDFFSVLTLAPPAGGEPVEGPRQMRAETGSVKMFDVQLRSPTSPTTDGNDEDVAGGSDDEDEGKTLWTSGVDLDTSYRSLYMSQGPDLQKNILGKILRLS